MNKAVKIASLWDFAIAHPDGFTWADFRVDHDWAHHRSNYFHIVRALRLWLTDKEVNLVCTPRGPGQLWKYRLVGTYSDGMQPWSANRLDDMESRLETVLAVAKSIVAATDGRSQEGRRARLVKKTVGRLIEDLQEMRA